MAEIAEVKYTLIGDIVGSKAVRDRSKLQASLVEVLRTVNRNVVGLEEVRPTVGDEVQGSFSGLSMALRATLLLRLELLIEGGSDSRFGIGLGEVTVFDPEAGITQDGPGWWVARTAIDEVEWLAQRKRTAFMRTRFEIDRTASPGNLPGMQDVPAVNAFLALRDQLVDRMNSRRRRLLLGALKGELQVEQAENEGIEQSAVSLNLAVSGANAILAAEEELVAGR